MDEPVSAATIDPLLVLLIVAAIVLVGGALILLRRRRETVIIHSEEPPRPQQRSLAPGADPELAALISAGQLIPAIKLVRERTGLGLKEAKEIVEAIAEGRPVDLPSRRPPAVPGELDSEVRGLLERGLIIDAIKLVRERTGLGLKEAKDYVDRMR